MAKIFTFVDRLVPLTFEIGEEPVTITICIGDELDAKIDKYWKKLIKTAMSAEEKRKILENWIGVKNTEAILSRFEQVDKVDGYVLDELLLFIRQAYFEAKQGNLQAAQKGRQA